MEIRPATPADVPAVLPMVRRVCAFHERLDPAKYSFRDDPAHLYRDWLARRATDPRSVFLVADRGGGGDKGKLVGFLVGTVEDEIPIYRVEAFGFLHDLWVEDDYRHEGLARQMVTLAIERFREIGVTQVRLDVAAGNEPARALFERCGFRPSVTEMLMEVESPKPVASSKATIVSASGF
jgi:ribosomal protein S18 acetylase RimI-like enzyme